MPVFSCVPFKTYHNTSSKFFASFELITAQFKQSAYISPSSLFILLAGSLKTKLNSSSGLCCCSCATGGLTGHF